MGAPKATPAVSTAATASERPSGFRNEGPMRRAGDSTATGFSRALSIGKVGPPEIDPFLAGPPSADWPEAKLRAYIEGNEAVQREEAKRLGSMRTGKGGIKGTGLSSDFLTETAKRIGFAQGFLADIDIKRTEKAAKDKREQSIREEQGQLTGLLTPFKGSITPEDEAGLRAAIASGLPAKTAIDNFVRSPRGVAAGLAAPKDPEAKGFGKARGETAYLEERGRLEKDGKPVKKSREPLSPEEWAARQGAREAALEKVRGNPAAAKDEARALSKAEAEIERQMRRFDGQNGWYMRRDASPEEIAHWERTGDAPIDWDRLRPEEREVLRRNAEMLSPDVAAAIKSMPGAAPKGGDPAVGVGGKKTGPQIDAEVRADPAWKNASEEQIRAEVVHRFKAQNASR